MSNSPPNPKQLERITVMNSHRLLASVALATICVIAGIYTIYTIGALYYAPPDPLVIQEGTIYYVAPSGNDYYNGTTTSTPFRTIQKALNSVTAGDTILIHGGTYRPSRELFLKVDGTAENPIIVSSYNTDIEPVVIKGSDLMDSGWTRVPDDPNAISATYHNNIWKRKIDDFPSSYPHYTQQAFIHFTSSFPSDEDGHPLRQVGPINPKFKADLNSDSVRHISKTIYDDSAPGTTVSGVPYAGSFYYYWGQDYNEDSPSPTTNPLELELGYLYIRLHDFSPEEFDPDAFDPNIDPGPDATDTGSIEVSIRNRVLLHKASHQAGEPHRKYYEFHDLQFKHSNGSRSLIIQGSGGYVVYIGPHSLIKNCVIAWGDFIGLLLSQSSTAENCTLRNNGALGASGSNNITFRQCIIEKNNERRFDYNNHAGGIKICSNHWGTVTECVVQNNYGPGIWFDWCNSENTCVISNNLVLNNTAGESGIFFECSQNALITNNIVSGNKRRGIYLAQSRNAAVMNNTVTETEKYTAIDLNGFPSGYPRRDREGNVFYLEDNLIYNNLIFNNHGTADLALASNPWSRNNTIDNNCYYRSDGDVKLYTAGGRHPTLSSWQVATGQDLHSISQEPDLNLNSYAPNASSPLIDAGAWVSDFTNTDYSGNTRPHFANFDIGAVEYTADLALHLPLDEATGSTAYDHSRYENHSTNDGTEGFPAWSMGKSGASALKFDGIDDRLVIANDESLTPSRNFTIMAWMKPATLTDDSVGINKQHSYRILMWKDGDSAVTCEFSIVNNSGTRFSIHPTPKKSGNGSRKYPNKNAPTSSFPTNQWHHVTGVYNGQEITLYVNGVEIGKTPATGDLQKNSCDLLLGMVDTSRFYKGYIDDVRIYGSALTPTQVLQTCDQGRLSLHLSFDEGRGNIAYDHSPQENDSICDDTQEFPAWSVGKSGVSALKFDGIDDHVSIPNADCLNPVEHFTVMAWLKPGPLTHDVIAINKEQSYRILVRKNGDSAVSFEFNMTNDDGGSSTVYDSGALYPIGQWYHVAGIYNGTKILLYINGVMVNKAKASGSVLYTQSLLEIGSGGGNSFFTGAIDDVRMYNTALFDSEIRSIFENP